jgi:serine/threonine protein phosphatase PrpC
MERNTRQARTREQWEKMVKAHQELRNQRRVRLTEGQEIIIQQASETTADGSFIRAEDIPANLTEMEVETDLGNINGRCFYGGPGAAEICKQENKDSLFAGVDRDGSVFLGVVDGIRQKKTSGSMGSAAGNRSFRECFQSDMSRSMDSVFSRVNRRMYDEKSAASAAAARMTPEGKLEIGTVGNTKAIVIVNDCISFSSSPQNKAFSAAGTADYYKHSGKNSVTESLGEGLGTGHECAEFQFNGGDEVTVILASNGALGDLMSDHEVLELFRRYKGDSLAFQEALFRKAYSRNNSKNEFIIQHDAETAVPMPPVFGQGDNITVQVVQFKVPTISEQDKMQRGRAERRRAQEEAERRRAQEEKEAKRIKSSRRVIDPTDPHFEPSHYIPASIEEALTGLGFEADEIEILSFKTDDPEKKARQKALLVKKYRSIAFLYHPDRKPTNEHASKIFKKATIDYKFLLQALELTIATS